VGSGFGDNKKWYQGCAEEVLRVPYRADDQLVVTPNEASSCIYAVLQLLQAPLLTSWCHGALTAAPNQLDPIHSNYTLT
jgi:hypothetical protein